MYTDVNFKTKKALRDAVASGQKIGIFQPGLGPSPQQHQKVCLEGPHYPAPHRWYASAILDENCHIKSVK